MLSYNIPHARLDQSPKQNGQENSLLKKLFFVSKYPA